MLDRFGRLPGRGALPVVVVLAPLAVASLTHFRPPVAVELFDLLQTEYRGRTIVAPNLGPWLANPELAFALTGGRAIRTSGLEVTPDDLRRFEPLRDAEGNLTYICLDTLYIRKMAKLGESSVCQVAESRMLQRGHEVVDHGFGWTVMRVHSEDRPTSATVVEMTPAQEARWQPAAAPIGGPNGQH
jgi:hypothetical protein